MNVRSLLGDIVLGNTISLTSIKKGRTCDFIVKDTQILLDFIKANNNVLDIDEENIYDYFYNISEFSEDVVIENECIVSKETLTTEEKGEKQLRLESEPFVAPKRTTQFLDESDIAKRELAVSRYYMLLSRFRKSLTMRKSSNLKSLTRDKLITLLNAYEVSTDDYQGALQEYVDEVNSVLKKRVENHKRKDTRQLKVTYLDIKDLDRYVRKNMEIMNFIVNNLRNSLEHLKDNPSRLLKNLVPDEMLYSKDSFLKYPLDVRYKHLKKKLKFNLICKHYENIIDSDLSDKREDSFNYIKHNYESIHNSLNLLKDALQNTNGIHYLVKSFGLNDLNELINMLNDCKYNYMDAIVNKMCNHIPYDIVVFTKTLYVIIEDIQESYREIMSGKNISSKYLDYWNTAHKDVHSCDDRSSDTYGYLEDEKVINFNQSQIDKEDYIMPRIGEDIDGSDINLDGILKPDNSIGDNEGVSTVSCNYDYDEMPYLAVLKQSPKEFAKGRYYMMFKRFSKSTSGVLQPIKYMSYSSFCKLVYAYENPNFKFEDSVEEFISCAKHKFEVKYMKLQRLKPETYNRMWNKYCKKLSLDDVTEYINKGINIVEFIRDNLLTEKERQQSCGNLCSTIKYLFASVENCYDMTGYPEVIRYKHLKKKLKFNRIKYHLEILLNSNNEVERNRAIHSLTYGLPKFELRVRFLMRVLTSDEGCKYLVKAYGCRGLSDMITDLTVTCLGYLERLCRPDALDDVCIDSLRGIIKSSIDYLHRLQDIYDKRIEYMNRSEDIKFFNETHREPLDDCKGANISDWL